ncbi:hypothetical protein O3M35_006091 [Rhynocoris fuscipes]|uniref:Uncharacterized protein n=1 Tax=Rhynocoris fuscipes TaxID=488301 RepID=A0AAW1DC81_9HEMI
MPKKLLKSKVKCSDKVKKKKKLFGKNQNEAVNERLFREQQQLNHDTALKNELQTLLDNFGQTVSEPILPGRTPDAESSLVELSVRKVVYKEKQHSHEQQQQQRNPLQNDFTDQTRTESDVPSITDCACDCINNNNCPDPDCLCHNDVDSNNSMQPIFIETCNCEKCRQQEISRNSCFNRQNNEEKYRNEIQGLNKERINRYSLNHIQYLKKPFESNKQKKWSLLSFLNVKDKKKHNKTYLKNKCSRTDIEENSRGSGYTVPQLYKANISRTMNGITPGKFTFRAVTGCPSLFEISAPNGNYENTVYYIKEPSRNKHCYDSTIFIDDKCGFRSGENKSESAPTKDTSKNDSDDPIINIKETGKGHGKGHERQDEYVVTRPPPERIDIYCFDHLNTGYFRTTDHPPPLISDMAIERVEAHATRFWAEIFGFIHLFNAFIIAFILQLYKFMLYGLIRPMLVGLVQLTSDYLIKPTLTVSYNGFIQPVFIFMFNILTSFRDLCVPLAKGIGYFLHEIAVVFKAIRLFDWKHTTIAKHSKVGGTKQV